MNLNFKLDKRAVATSAALILIILLLNPQGNLKITLLITAILAPSALLQFYADYSKSKEAIQMEREIPLAMFQIASYQQRTPFEKILTEVANALPPKSPLAIEFKNASNKIKQGTSVPKALVEINHRESQIVKRTISLLIQTYTSGYNTSSAFSEIAQDTFELQAIDEEVKANAALQKYTILLASAVFVPLILAMLTTITSNLNLDSSIMQTQITQETRAEILSATLTSLQVYLVILALLASTFVAIQEKHLKKATVYFSITAPIALLIFTIISKL